MGRYKTLLPFLMLMCCYGTCWGNPIAELYLGSSGVGLGSRISKNLTLEIRDSLNLDLHMDSLRGEYGLSYLLGVHEINPFLGIEYGIIKFNSQGIKGTGSLLSGVIGCEMPISSKFSVVTDIGYSNISLKSLGSTVSGPEWIFNIGLRFNMASLRL